jgi:DNA repair ATPase RecN
LKGYESEEIVLNLSVDAQDYSNLVVVTGETGSGKSLLVSKVAELITGGKATPALLNAPKGTSSVDSRATVEMGRSYRYEEYVFVDATVSHAFLVLHGRLLCSSGTG